MAIPMISRNRMRQALLHNTYKFKYEKENPLEKKANGTKKSNFDAEGRNEAAVLTQTQSK